MHSIVMDDLVNFAAELFSMDAETPVRKNISNDDDTIVSQGTCVQSALVSDTHFDKVHRP